MVTSRSTIRLSHTGHRSIAKKSMPGQNFNLCAEVGRQAVPHHAHEKSPGIFASGCVGPRIHWDHRTDSAECLGSDFCVFHDFSAPPAVSPSVWDLRAWHELRSPAYPMAAYDISDIERRAALTELILKADPLDAVRRHRVVFTGSPDRHTQLPRLAAAYVQAKLVERFDRTTA